jgi:hypothetical protein
MRLDCAKKLQEALGLTEAPTVLSVEGFGFISLPGFGKPQQEVYVRSSLEDLANFHARLLRRVVHVVAKVKTAGVEDDRGVPIPGNNKLTSPHLISLRALQWLEGASDSAIRAAYQQITGKRVARPRQPDRPLMSFTPPPRGHRADLGTLI